MKKFFISYKLLLKNTAYALLLVAAAIALYQLAARFPLHADLTQNASNSLQASSVDTLQQMQDSINITVYVTGQDAEMGDVRRLVRDFIGLYQRYKPGITLAFVDPVKEPEAMRRASVRANGEIVVEYGGRNEHLTVLNEQSLTSALLRLAHSKNQLLMYVDGHGERKLDGPANHDLGAFGKKLQQNGFNVASLNLAIAQEVPGNASVLVITQPQIKLLPGEVDKLLRYVDGGGNLLWLLDAEPLLGLEQLADKLDIQLTPGMVIDPDAQKMRAPANWALGASYPPHPVTYNFNLITAFPYARALGREDSMGRADGSPWQVSTLVEGAAHGWVSRNPVAAPKKPQFDKNRDMPGPVSLALALQRNVHEHEQRIVVVGSGSFLANAYSGNGGNLDLGVNMVNWLTHEENLITAQPRATRDSAITLSKRQLTAIIAGFLIALPLLLAAIGAVQWWRRRS